mmetsp:Transcript_36417/g.89763  ORF Transcript_36417/g.89763 Transcript_36417/m.89763 type:complete len:233 (-) Transcript_36417:214-912(-)
MRRLIEGSRHFIQGLRHLIEGLRRLIVCMVALGFLDEGAHVRLAAVAHLLQLGQQALVANLDDLHDAGHERAAQQRQGQHLRVAGRVPAAHHDPAGAAGGGAARGGGGGGLDAFPAFAGFAVAGFTFAFAFLAFAAAAFAAAAAAAGIVAGAGERAGAAGGQGAAAALLRRQCRRRAADEAQQPVRPPIFAGGATRGVPAHGSDEEGIILAGHGNPSWCRHRRAARHRSRRG